MNTFGSLLRYYRLRAGLGLRTFAALIEQRASTVSAIESGRRTPWRREPLLARIAEVLGLAEASERYQHLFTSTQNGYVETKTLAGKLLWWWTTEDSSSLDTEFAAELANFLSADFALDDAPGEPTEALTELAIEWRVRQLLGRRSTQIASAPVDVESLLETEADVRLEIVPGMIPRFSVQACIVRSAEQTTLYVDRIVADSRPTSSYRYLLAQCYAPAVLWQSLNARQDAGWFLDLQSNGYWSGAQRDCERFALAMMLPATPVLSGAESAYRELVQQQGWVELDEATSWVRNRLAEQFAVPPALVHRRLLGWPCHLYGRIAQALAAEELTLPPSDWLADQTHPQQRLLFDRDLS
ncbi:MAG: helix-turn-helix domain-containing protein [Pirellulales bacterium]|nr:helix-turn-helix domain-containing protein [Pirellulales bacterium]